MATTTRITATVVFDVVTANDEELDTVCEDIHAQFDVLFAGNDWSGSVELSWETVAA